MLSAIQLHLPVPPFRPFLIIVVIVLMPTFVTKGFGQFREAAFKRAVTEIRSIDPTDTSYTDFAGLKKAIGEARIVLLGEQTHGEGSTFLAKTRIIKYLHQQLGFDVLAFESGLYDVTRIWENTRNGGQFSKEVIGSLFYMYATSKQMQPLFNYIQSGITTTRPLQVAGFESQHSGVHAKNLMFADFEKFLRQKDPASIDEQWKIFRQVTLATIGSRAYRPAAAEKEGFFKKLESLKKLLENDRQPVNAFLESTGFWYRITCSIESQALRYWEMVQGNEVSVRDRQMAENLIWLAEKAYPGKKIIVWAHNVHVAKSTDKLQFPTGSGEGYFFSSFEPMGATVHKHFGENAFTIGFTSAEGKYQDYTNDKIMNVPAPVEGSVEARLYQAGYPSAFVDLRSLEAQVKGSVFPAAFSDFSYVRANWPVIFDGIFYIRQAFPVDR